MKQFEDILEELRAIRKTLEVEEEKPFILRYPRTGKKELPVGKSILDITTMTVKLADGSIEKVYPPKTIELCRSAAIYVDNDVNVEFSLKGTTTYDSTLSPFRTRIPALDFDRLEITTTIPTMLAIEMATVVDGVPFIQPSPIAVGTPEESSQRSIKFEDDISISGRSVGILKLKDPVTGADYVVPLGYRLVIGISLISCSLPIWQHTYLVVTPGLIGDYRYKGRGQVEFPLYAATTVAAGTTPLIYIFNEDEESLNFSIAINAIEEKVS